MTDTPEPSRFFKKVKSSGADSLKRNWPLYCVCVLFALVCSATLLEPGIPAGLSYIFIPLLVLAAARAYLKSFPETGKMNFFIKALCFTFIFELILLMGLLGECFYSAPKTLNNIKALESTLALRYSRPFNAYYILMCGRNYDYCYEGLLGGNSVRFLDGLKNVSDIYSEDDALVIVMREGQDMRPQLQAEDVGYKFDETVIVDGVRRELYSSIYSLEVPDGQNTVKCHRIIVKYIL